ncbi:squamous cell carcinoma antigen recognized by T-cells 3 [Caerostris extrusa]|uniref:Squamous cell carcinoma antigen recognized by T-cells 3 n=1 Tax=Caerostris extrusa TaxID=172846 RepID=A0AAV4QPC1_CAEEX|nr:squamous cell carcinoma antigen recognized by T-cells 3 [Caerostris extrusa]
MKDKESQFVCKACLKSLMENCLQDDLWMDYTKYMDYGVKIPDMSLIVHERAVRNCPWSVKLWVGYVKALERFEQPQENNKILGNSSWYGSYKS